MNKLLAILGLIALLGIGGLFFFAGFFTGSTVKLTPEAQKNIAKNIDKLPISEVEKTINTESASLSEKIQKILNVASGNDMPSAKNDKKNELENLDEAQISINSLLKEIAASHASGDDCSVNKTQQQLNINKPQRPNSLEGKRIVFVGYFKTNIAAQIQRLLLQKGYKVHVEESRTSNHESFVFCGPFRDNKNAQNLVNWLNKHNFSDARIVKVERDTLEETLYDASANDSDMPNNVEKDIPETTEAEMKAQQQQMVQQQAMMQQQQMAQQQTMMQQQQMAQQQAMMQQQQMAQQQ